MIFIPLVFLVISLISYYPFDFYNGLFLKITAFIIILTITAWCFKKDLKSLLKQ